MTNGFRNYKMDWGELYGRGDLNQHPFYSNFEVFPPINNEGTLAFYGDKSGGRHFYDLLHSFLIHFNPTWI